jgi:excisionase family DNA binding protein
MTQHAPNIPPDIPPDGARHATDAATDMSSPLRATVEEAAKILRTSENAVRKRIERGTLPSEKVDGVRYVLLLDSDMPQHADDTAGGSVTDMSTGMPAELSLMQAHLDSMQEQVSYLKAVVQTRDEELRRKDHIIAALTERIPELEAPREARSEAREGHVMASEEADKGKAPPEQQEPSQRRSWWRSFFGLE